MAFFRDAVYLVKTTHDHNEDDDLVITPQERLVPANQKSVRQTEFYQAAASGLRPEIAFEIRSSEYEGEKTVKYPAAEEGEEYTVYRSYDRGNGFLELICTGPGNRPGTRRGP
ncbi:head-tail adaptor protein [Candidatus Contubernalis alkaliaceticus]|uniref:head-tail adaptor protein n=1 Tax=Candidatus Contubernalis alkaliaceticus TaxID=338645 RepID=UPI001F4BD3ED|nr:head-tail adaptor protein [Candidatus Contubernalis alkalaceticus]UNC91693.1 head-tail adaptor protein [Candidatus Contubernalis alkalaceticus]